MRPASCRSAMQTSPPRPRRRWAASWAIGLLAPRSTYPLGSIMPRASPITGWRWLETPPTACTRSPARGSMSATAMRLPWRRSWSRRARLGLDLGDHQLMTRYQRWRSLDTFMVSLATDGLTRVYGIPGRTASKVRRFGMSLINRIGEGPSDGRGARHQRRPAAAASGIAQVVLDCLRQPSARTY